MNKMNTTISTYCFMFGLLFYIIVHDYLMPKIIQNPTSLKIVIEVLSTLGFYVAIFQIANILYERYLFKKIDPRFNLDGDWYQVFTSGNGSSPVIRHGPCRITCNVDGIIMSATNYNLENELSSNWQSETVSLSGNRITLLFVSEGKSRKIPIKKGSMAFNLHGCPPDTLSGIFNDLSPGKNFGDIRIFRNKAEYERHLNTVTNGQLSNQAN